MVDFTDAVAYQELRSQFSANVSHELRTPLTGLGGPDRGAGRRGHGSGPTPLCRIARASEIQRLVALISDVLFLSELEATGDTGPRRGPTPHVAIDNAVEALGDVAAEHGVRWRSRPTGPSALPLTERWRRRGAEPGRERGQVRRLGVRHDRVRAAVSDDGRWVEIACSRQRTRGSPSGICRTSSSASTARTRRAPSVSAVPGLGLSIVKHIAERFGGTAEASSRQGFGTTVTSACRCRRRRQPPAAGEPAPGRFS